MRSAICEAVLVPAALLAEVARTGNGATVLFVGTVRDMNEGRHVRGIEYSAYTRMADPELRRIVSEASERFGTDDIVAEHRVGALLVGDISVAVAAAHPHRAAAFDAARFVIEELKRRVPVWKREQYVDGTSDWADPTQSEASAQR
jgi:molybdopterin synthase catalytic subunit